MNVVLSSGERQIDMFYEHVPMYLIADWMCGCCCIVCALAELVTLIICYEEEFKITTNSVQLTLDSSSFSVIVTDFFD